MSDKLIIMPDSDFITEFSKSLQKEETKNDMLYVDGHIDLPYFMAACAPDLIFDDLDKDPIVNTLVNTGPIFGEMFFNSKEGIMKGNYQLRQAVQAAMDLEPALMAAIGPKSLWAANGSIMPKGTFWYTEAGVKNYSQGDADLAKKLAEEAGREEVGKAQIQIAPGPRLGDVVIEADGLTSIACQHEIDHLDGILFVTKFGPADRLRARRRLRKLEEEYQVRVGGR